MEGRGEKAESGLIRRASNRSSRLRPDKDLVVGAEDFLFAGSSALLLLVANLFPAYWYVSFVALTPFLWRVSRALPKEAFRLGALLGGTFFLFSSLEALALAPIATALKIVSGAALFALWGWGVGVARLYFGFNPIIVAGLWVFFELGLVKLGYTSGLLVELIPSNSFFWSIITLFGLGFLSFAIVLINTLLIRAIEYFAKALAAQNPIPSSSDQDFRSFYESDLISLSLMRLPRMRGPPGPIANKL